jgi:hypothetical protein
MSISVWIRDRPERHCLGDLPDEVELHMIPDGAPLPANIRGAERLVPPYNSRPVLELLTEMPGLAVVKRSPPARSGFSLGSPRG